VAYPARILEKDICAEFIWYLTLLQTRSKLFFLRVPGGPCIVNDRLGNRRFVKNPAAGLPDFLIWLKDGPFLGIEAKRQGGVQSEVQQHFQSRLEQVGHAYHICRSLIELQGVLARHGCTL